MSGIRNENIAAREEMEPYAGFAGIYDRSCQAWITKAGPTTSSPCCSASAGGRAPDRPRLRHRQLGHPFAARGYRVGAVDLSEAMLQVARDKPLGGAAS